MVETQSHKRQRLHHTEPILQTPSKRTRIPRRDKNARPHIRIRIRNQCLDIRVRLANRVSEKPNHSCVRDNAPVPLSDHGRPLCNRIAQLATAIMTVNPLGKAGCTPPDPAHAQVARCTPESPT